MSPSRSLPAQTVHASSVAIGGRAVLVIGPSGAGKSDLALRLIDRGFTLISDDQTIVKRDGDRVLASAPAQIAGELEIRGIGIIEMETVGDLPVALVVELRGDMERLPDDSRDRPLLGIPLPLVSLDPTTASAAAKVALALDKFGLKLT